MTTLIIGAGLVGSQVARILVGEGERVAILDVSPQREALADFVDVDKLTIVSGSIMNPFDLARAMRDVGATRVVHTAAYPMLTEGAQQDPYGAIQVNVMGTVNVLEAARLQGVERVVAASSGVLTRYAAGGEDEGDPSKEEAYPRPTTFYAATKQAVESLGVNYASWTGVDFVAVRFAAVAGPWRGRGGGGPTQTFRTLVEKSLAGEPSSIPNRPAEWVYSKDAAQGMVLALKAPDLKHRVFNISMGRVYTPEEMIDALRQVIPGANVAVRQGTAVTESPTGIDMVALNLDRSRAELGFEPQFDFADAVRDYVEWYEGRLKL